MLRDEESRERQFHRYVELGRDNLECIAGMQRWCKHVELEPTSRGLYAEITGLPIASHTIGCPYVEGKTGGMNLRWIVSDFLIEHCTGCPHHSPNGDDSWGQGIIDEHTTQLEHTQQFADETNLRIRQLRAELRDKSASMKGQATVEARSILAYLEAVFSECEEERNQASERIKQAVSLGADLLPIEAARLITALARTPEYSEAMLPVCAVLAPALPDLAEDLIETALTNIEKGLHVEMSAAVFDALGDSAPYPINELHVRQLVLSQDHHPLATVFNREGSNYVHSTSVLIKSFDANPESVTSVVRQELENELEQFRHSVCGAIALIQKERPGIALDLLDSLIASLNLYESDETSYGPSTKIVPVLREALRYSPLVVDQAIAATFARARPAVQGDLADVYQQLHGSDDDVNPPCAPQLADVVVGRLWDWVRDERLIINIRTQSLDSLESAYSRFPARSVDDFGPLLGYLAIVSAQEEPSGRPPAIEIPGHPENQLMDQLDRQTDRIRWNAFKRGLADCLTMLSRQDPHKAFQAIADCLDQPLDQINPEFKTHCVSILGDVAAKYEVRPQALPYLWRALMDFSSPGTRAEAIEATVKMFGNGVCPPQNLVEIIMVYLRDTYVVVHQAALQAVIRRRYWFDASQQRDLLAKLEVHLNVYRQKTYQIDDICEAIMRVANADELHKVIALRLIRTVFPTGEEFVDRDIAGRMIRFCEPSEKLAPQVAKMVATYLAEHGRRRLNNYGDKDRAKMLEWFRNLAPANFQLVSNDLMRCALQVAERDAWEACGFAGIFAYFMDFEKERDVLAAALMSIPDEPRHAEQRNYMRRLLEAATMNASFQANEPEQSVGPQTRR